MIKNIFSNWTGFFVNVIIALLLSPLIVHSLGESVYGIWILIGSLTGYLGILDLGVRTSLVKYVSEYIAKKDFDALNETFNTSLVTFLLIGAVTVLVSCVLPLMLPLLLSNPALDYDTIRWAIFLVGCDIAISFPLGLYGGFLSGMQRYDLSNLIEIVSAIGRALATVIVLKMGLGIVALAAIALASSIFASAFRIVIVHRACPQLAIRFRLANRATLQRISTYGANSLMVIAASRIIFYSDSVVISTFMSTAAVTYFALATNLVEYVRRFIKSMTNVFIPAISGLKATQQKEKLGELLYLGTRYTLLLMVWIGVTLLAYRREFFALWMGPEFALRSAEVLLILLVPQILAMGMYNFSAMLYGIAKHRALALMSIAEALVNLLLSIVLVKKYGLAGVALGTAIPQMLNYVVWLPLYGCRLLGLSYFDFMRKAVLPPLLTVVPLLLAIFIAKAVHPADNWLRFITQLAFCSGVFVLVIWRVFLRYDLKQYATVRRGKFWGLLRLQTKS